ncbi:enah/Vasp-like a isoform X5 [Denticeps clupeoides]|uniref:enah/Vasp-like a isoform X5 n=1 Tax=Denticeps clupeoides TaxID=299321 RepID=UPI0010A2E162|nr:ena/VASP-like protein isoform X5 [Denticeps clupeoides]
MRSLGVRMVSTIEQSICQARASVMVYDDSTKKWVPVKPGQQGFSRINIYHNTASNTFRVVGVKLQDQQVVINYSIVKGLKYNQATPTFHQWRDARQVYGLNFASKEEATTFSNAMLFALNVLNSQEAGPAGLRQNGPVSDDTEAQRRQAMEHHVERERRAAASAVSTLQFKVSAPSSSSSTQSNAATPDYRQYRANTLPPSYMQGPPSASPPSSSSSSSSASSQEREGGACCSCDSPNRKAQQQLSQLSTSLASAFSPIQQGVNTQGRRVRQIPLSPPTMLRCLPQLVSDPQVLPTKHSTWSASSASHMFAPVPSSASPPVVVGLAINQVCPQPVLPVALPLPSLNSGRGKASALEPVVAKQHANGQPEEYFSLQHHPHTQQPQTQHYQAQPIQHQVQLGPNLPHPTCCEVIGQAAQIHTHPPLFPSPSSLQQQQQTLQQQHPCQLVPNFGATHTPSYSTLPEGGLPKTAPSPVIQVSPPVMSPPLPPGHPSMHASTAAGPVNPPSVLMSGPPAPPPPPGPPPPSIGPPHTPPPLSAPGAAGGQSGLAAALAGAKLRKVQRPEENSSAGAIGKNDASRSSGGSGGSGEGLMQEMNALLARRRKASEKPDEKDDGQKEEADGSPITRDPVKKPWDRANSTEKSTVMSKSKPTGGTIDGEIDFDRMKQEILEEVVRELHKVKDEIIDAIRREVNRMSTT